MDFTFTEDQRLFQESVHDFLVSEVTPERVRSLWETDTGRSEKLYQQLVELGLTGITVPEAFGGLGMNELDFILLAEACGYVALPENLVNTALVVVPTLTAWGSESLKQHWLPKIAAGEAKVAVGLQQNLLVEDAHTADLLLLDKAGKLYAVEPDALTLTHNPSVDPSRKLFQVDFNEQQAEFLTDNPLAINGIINRGALGVAAQSLGLAQRMIDLSVTYTSERQQFGVAIGTFQAVKHQMANIAYRLEYAKAPVARAAYALANGSERSDLYVSHAKLVACEVADLAAKNSIQVHGAMGYTWEVDLHIFMKKAWAFKHTWGDAAFHKNRVADAVLAKEAVIGAGSTFE